MFDNDISGADILYPNPEKSKAASQIPILGIINIPMVPIFMIIWGIISQIPMDLPMDLPIKRVDIVAPDPSAAAAWCRATTGQIQALWPGSGAINRT